MKRVILYLIITLVSGELSAQKVRNSRIIESDTYEIKYELKKMDYENQTAGACNAVSYQKYSELEALIKNNYNKVIKPVLGEIEGVIIVSMTFDNKGDFANIKLLLPIEFSGKISNTLMEDFALNTKKSIKPSAYIKFEGGEIDSLYYRFPIFIQRLKR